MICVDTETLARDSLHLRIRRRVGPDDTRELADAHVLERVLEATPIPLELERPAGELEPKRRRFRVNPVRAADHRRMHVFLRARHDCAERCIDPFENESPGVLHGERQRGVDDVRGREAVVEPTARCPEVLGNRVDERGYVVVRRALELGDPLGSGHLRRLPDLGRRLGRHCSNL
jgi:hypothetical protein